MSDRLPTEYHLRIGRMPGQSPNKKAPMPAPLSPPSDCGEILQGFLINLLIGLITFKTTKIFWKIEAPMNFLARQ